MMGWDSYCAGVCQLTPLATQQAVVAGVIHGRVWWDGRMVGVLAVTALDIT